MCVAKRIRYCNNNNNNIIIIITLFTESDTLSAFELETTFWREKNVDGCHSGVAVQPRLNKDSGFNFSDC